MTIMKRVREHYDEALKYFKEEQIVGIFLQGSQNYTLDIPESDVDTKLIVVPSFKDIALNKHPVSTTHIRENTEHIDFKDVRLYMETFRKQNLNFLEILFTKYAIINPMYADQWNRLVAAREDIAHMNEFRAIKSMKGIALEKYHAMEHRYPTRVAILDKYGYDPKQLHHLVRVDNYLTRYMMGETYENCLIPEEKMKYFLLDIKLGKFELAGARNLAELSLEHINKITDEYFASHEEKENETIKALLEDVSYNIMKISVENELKGE